MDLVTLGAALNGSAEYVNSHFKGGSNIQIVDNPDGTQTINASGEVSAEDTVARAEIVAIKDGETLDSFGDVETALTTKANAATTYTKTEVDTALSAKANSTDVYSKSDVDTALSGKVDKETGKGLSTNDYTTDEKTKLAGIEAQANKTTVDDVLSGSSTNPVQNKVIKSALDSKADTTDIPTVPITAIQKNGTGIAPVSGTVNITVPTQASDINAATATQGGKADTAIQGIKVNSSTVNPDSNKIVSITIPTSAADVSAIPTSAKGANSGVAELDATGKVPASQLPPYVDDVIEGYYYNSKFYEDSAHTTEITGTTGKIYVDLSTNKAYRWSGSGYTEISASLALGTTSSTAYRGDRGATAYTHATDSSRLTTAKSSGLYKVASTSQGHIASLTAVQKSDITALGIPAQDTTVGSGIVLTGYEKSSTGGQAVEATDTVNEAIGKIEKRVSDNESNISTDEAALVELVDGGAKSLLPNNAVSQTINSVVFVVNADGSVTTVSGTASSAAYLIMCRPNLKKGKYVISGSDGEIGVGIGTDLTSSSIIALSRNGNPVEFELTNDTNNLYYFVRMSTGVSANNNTIYPMLCTKAAWDISHTYQPYRPSYQELYDEVETNKNNISTDEAALVELVDSGAKNVINNTLTNGSTSNQVTATVDSNLKVTLSGTAPSNLDASFAISSNKSIPAGTYKGSGCPSGGAIDKYRIDYIVNNSTVYRDTGNGIEFTVVDGDVIRSQIVVYRGNTAPSAPFAPMVCTKAAWNVSRKYVPYAPTNAKLYEMIKALQPTQ